MISYARQNSEEQPDGTSPAADDHIAPAPRVSVQAFCETVETAAVREVKEELDLRVEITRLVGVYSRAEDRTVVVVYAAAAQGTPSITEEALEVRAFSPIDIPWQDLAFWSETNALRDYLGSGSRPERS